MIITRTPFRISFVGGGTDLESYYKTGYGAVVSATINKYMFITLNKRFDDSIRVSYSVTEIVDDVNDIKHDIVREALKMTGITKGIEITSISDIPSGTGLGSSSSFCVGLLNALYAYKGEHLSPSELAEKAYYLEKVILNHPVGKQDHYAAAFGGLNYFKFNADGSVEHEKIDLDKENIENMNLYLSAYFTNLEHDANKILKRQSEDTNKKLELLDYMKNQANELKDELKNNGFNNKFALFLKNGWEKKRKLTNGISNITIDQSYEKALNNGALGGKLLGAGGGGFLLFYCLPKDKQKMNDALGLKQFHFKFNNTGSSIIYLPEE